MITRCDFLGFPDCQPVIMADRRVRAPTLIPVVGLITLLVGMDWYRLGDEIRSD
jgi:hypothetical protein